MNSTRAIVCACVFGFCLVATTGKCGENEQGFDAQWPQWRGPDATGVSQHADPPLNWDENTNVKWKADIPGTGHASPIVWKDLVFVTTAIKTDKEGKPVVQSENAPRSGGSNRPGGFGGRGGRGGGPGGRGGFGGSGGPPTHIYKFDVLALKRDNGSVAWSRTVREQQPHDGTHKDGSWASCSPVTDGERLYAHFGSSGLYCLDVKGNVLWEKDLGDMSIRMSFGEGSSPVLYGDTLVVNWDHEGDSFIVALHKKTGEELWQDERNERTSWSTPLIAEIDGKPQVIVSATTRIRGYDLATGDVVWECGGLTENVIPSPVVHGSALTVMSGFRGSELMTIELSNAKGDLTNSEAVLWTHDRNTPYVPSPLLYGDTLYFLKSNDANLTCLNAESGEELYSRQKLVGLKGVYASPVGAAGRGDVTGRNGVTAVIELGPECKVLASNALDDSFTASTALAGNELFLRGSKSLYCIAEE